MYKINITDYFLNTVLENSGRIAISDRGRTITFTKLYEQIIKAAIGIRTRLGGKNGHVIAVYMGKSIETVIADLAILYSGNAYLNLDIKSPLSRIEAVLNQIDPALILYTGDMPRVKLPTVDIQELLSREVSREEEELLRANLAQKIDTDLMCLINTSGSTGIPKAVALNHRSFIDFTEAVLTEKLIWKNCTVGSLSPVIFDIFSFELCMMMAVGATLVLIPETHASFPVKMLRLMADTRVEFIFWVPTIMVNIANMKLLDNLDLPDLKMVWFAGEVFPTSKFNYWRTNLPGATFANFYGPIEITLDCLYHVVERDLPDNVPLPIGKPFRNTAILILDENNMAIGPESPFREGELCIRGSSLASGYFNNPEETAKAFTQNPLNTSYLETIYRTGDIVAWNEYGEVIFKGRKDTLVKHSGYRIELGEIEHVTVNAVADISNAAAIYDKARNQIVLFYEAQEELNNKIIYKELMRFLPRYMLPHKYVWLKEMPQNINGKIDRNYLNTIFNTEKKVKA